ncbi:probable trafficking protein particle complex subunit 13 homolog [Drosophila tropicalis]|uniref:probable trafficking protein particle complex subunit 13 homolog n=1 Tax=Drosophila tropicalis TaxID=46794 RepID=UPI0035ABEB74
MVLVCEVNYTTPAGFGQSLRKLFKFQVLKPLDVKTKFYNAEMDEIYLEAQIQNVTTGPFCLEKVELDNSEHYTVTSLNTLSNGESVLTSKHMLQPNNSCQFLYCIKPKSTIARCSKVLRQFTNVGKLDIVWRSSLGERGRLQTSQLQRLPFENEDLCLEVVDAKNIIKIGSIFSFLCRVTNSSDHPMKLHIHLDIKMLTNSYTGSADFLLEVLQPAEKTEFSLSISPSNLGLIRVSPLLLVDTLQNRRYYFEKVVDVFVVDADYHQDDVFFLNKLTEYENSQELLREKKIQLQVV